MSPEDFLVFLQSRRSVRRFRADPVPRAILERLVHAAVSAPSATNRQPWRFAVVTDPERRRRVVAAVQEQVAALGAIVARSHHADDYGGYGDFFHEPLLSAPVIVIPQTRTFPDLLGNLLRSGGAAPGDHVTPASMDPERCATAAAVMNLLLQARAEGLGATWMAGPTVARPRLEALLGITPPWQMLGAVAVGWPDEAPTPPARKSLTLVATFDDPEPG
jgi:coenzyme F420-0:L-glutamate ligase/coenzyme F420-1:gamma-L-glutamate ligase